jgi:hypothetical protein
LPHLEQPAVVIGLLERYSKVLSAECWVLATIYKRVLGTHPVLTYASTAI